MKNAFYFTLKAFIVMKIFKFLSWRFSQVEKTVYSKNKLDETSDYWSKDVFYFDF